MGGTVALRSVNIFFPMNNSSAARPATSVPQSDSGQDHSPWEWTIGVRVEDQREEDGTDGVGHYCRYSSLSQRKTHQGGEVICLPEKCDWQTWRLRSRHQEKNRQNTVTQKNIWIATKSNSGSSTPTLSLSCSMVARKELALEDPDIYKHLSIAWCTFNIR